MRLKIGFQLKKPELDTQYRRAFLSLLKQSFQTASTEIYEKFYGNGTPMKPFTFAVYLNQPKFQNTIIHLASTQIDLNFSTYLSELGIYFYNSLIKQKRHFVPYPLPNGNEMRLTHVSLQKEKPIPESEAVFKTLSPFLARSHDEENNRDTYLTKDEPGFITTMEEKIGVMIGEILRITEPVRFTPVSLKKGFPIKHYGINVQGNTGIFKLNGKPEILDFIYKAGIGSRRSEGFGMIEKV